MLQPKVKIKPSDAEYYGYAQQTDRQGTKTADQDTQQKTHIKMHKPNSLQNIIMGIYLTYYL